MCKALKSREVVVSLIGNTTTKNGLTITAELDKKQYPKGIKISDKDFDKINLIRNEFHDDWNYVIKPN